MRTQEEEEREGMRQSDPDRALLREKGQVAICVITFVTMPVHNDNKLKPVFSNEFSQLNKTVRCIFNKHLYLLYLCGCSIRCNSSCFISLAKCSSPFDIYFNFFELAETNASFLNVKIIYIFL